MSNLFESITNFFSFNKKSGEEEVEVKTNISSFVEPSNLDGAVVSEGGRVSYNFNQEINASNEIELIRRYREASRIPEVSEAIDEIVNECVSENAEGDAIALDLEKLDLSDAIKKKMTDEFATVLDLFEFKERGSDYLRKWYVDGRIYFHKIIDKSKPADGIKELRFINPISIKKIVETEKVKEGEINLTRIKREYFQYAPSVKSKPIQVADSAPSQQMYQPTFGQQNMQVIQVSPEAIAYVTSGMYDEDFSTVLSPLHPALRVTNQLKTLEDSLVIYRLARAPERRIFYIDVGGLTKPKADQYVKDMMSKFKNNISYDAMTGEIKDQRRHLSMMEDFWIPRRDNGKTTEITTLPGGCLAMDTKVSLMDGRELSITDIENEMKAGKELWTYSCDEFTGKVKPGLITWAGITQESAKVMKITLDNGESLICTPDHKFPIYNKGFVEAKDLRVDTSMIPLYRKKEILGNHKKNDYEMVFDNETKTWIYTHRMVRNEMDLPLEVFEEDFGDGYAVHHKNYNRYDNTPNNLCLMSFKDHRKYHSSIGFSKEAQQMGALASAARLQWIKETQKIEIDSFIFNTIIDSVKGKTTHQITIEDVVEILNENEYCVNRLQELNKDKSVPNWNVDIGFTVGIVRKAPLNFGYSSWLEFRKSVDFHNHRIISIEYLDEPITVGTLTIDDKEIVHGHHTFALSCGIFTKNSNLSQLEDVEYFLKKMYKSLKVPYSRFMTDSPVAGLGRSSEITREEIKFQKFIDRLRNRFGSMILDVLGSQLKLKGIMSEEEWTEFEPKVKLDWAKDNFFTEMKEAELIRERMMTLQQVDPYVGKYLDRKYVFTNVLRMTDEQVKEVEQGNEKDRAEHPEFFPDLMDPANPNGLTMPQNMPLDEPPEQDDSEDNRKN